MSPLSLDETIELLDRCKKELGSRGLFDMSRTMRYDAGSPEPQKVASMKGQELAKFIDHTLLKAEASQEEIERLCREAAQHNFAAVCVNSFHVKQCAQQLKDTKIRVASVVGFPLGANTTATKAFEAEEAVQNGAHEIDMVLNVGQLKAGDYEFVREDISSVVRAAMGSVVKVILETCLLTDEEKVVACLLCKDANAAFVKTSTGFNKGGATADDVRLMRTAVGNGVGVKASGGIRDALAARSMLAAGANRIGCSAGVAIATGGAGTSGY